MRTDPLRETNRVAVDSHVVDDRREEPPQAHPFRVVVALELVPEIEWADSSLDRVVAEHDRDGQVLAGPDAVEDRSERELEILQRLDRQLVPERDPAEDEVCDTLKLPLAWQREGDLVGLRH